MTKQRVKQLFDDCGYKSRERNFTQRRRRALTKNLIILPKEKLEKLYLEANRSMAEISEILNVTYYVLAQHFKEYGIPKRSQREIQKPRLKNPALTTDELIRLYVKEKLSSGQIAKMFGYNSPTIKIKQTWN